MADSLTSHRLIQAKGTKEYREAVLDHLRTIRKLQDGLKLLNRLQVAGFVVKIEDTTTGNACSYDDYPNSLPRLCYAMAAEDEKMFADEVEISLNRATQGGITLEHIARQLSFGLTPASYKLATNVVKPSSKWQSAMPSGLSGKEVMKTATDATASAKAILLRLAAGDLKSKDMPMGWDYDLPRVLRAFLTKGYGSAASVDFNPLATFHCVHDPAMHLRPPAIGLAHELIHAMHGAEGTNFNRVAKGGENVEEVITTGIPPYNYEPISDNKLRTQWPQSLALRHNY